jgi:hypothetical protein
MSLIVQGGQGMAAPKENKGAVQHVCRVGATSAGLDLAPGWYVPRGPSEKLFQNGRERQGGNIDPEVADFLAPRRANPRIRAIGRAMPVTAER